MNKKDITKYFNSNISQIGENRSETYQPKFDPTDYLSYGLTEKEILRLKETFDSYDIDKSGYVGVNKLRTAYKLHANLNADRTTIYHIIMSFDMDERAELSFLDFVRIASTQTPQATASCLISQGRGPEDFQRLRLEWERVHH